MLFQKESSVQVVLLIHTVALFSQLKPKVKLSGLL